MIRKSCKQGYFLGIDTSCYTTSVALIDSTGALLADERKLLEVPKGKRGLRQSEMVFQHTKNLPDLIAKAFKSQISCGYLLAVGASTVPRDCSESYMPVFCVSEGMGQSIAASHNVPFFSLSHQKGHIMAGEWSVGAVLPPVFLAVHLSGGTTETLLVTAKKDFKEITCLGATIDISAGQLIDRVGVLLGLGFPAGPELEQVAREGMRNPLLLPVAVRGATVSFSGVESQVRRSWADGTWEKAEIAAGVQSCIANSLFKWTDNFVKQTGIKDVLVVGGVAANQYIRRYLVENNSQICWHFAEAKLSGDNGVGAAFFAFSQYNFIKDET